MKGDFTRDTFYAHKHFSRVLMQQGRVTLDADHNEQAAILLNYTRKLARDIIGPHGAPAGEDGGFKLRTDQAGVFTISEGYYYVDGLLVENDKGLCSYKNQPYYLAPENDPLLAAIKSHTEGNPQFLIYLDVFERQRDHVLVFLALAQGGEQGDGLRHL